MDGISYVIQGRPLPEIKASGPASRYLISYYEGGGQVDLDELRENALYRRAWTNESTKRAGYTYVAEPAHHQAVKKHTHKWLLSMKARSAELRYARQNEPKGLHEAFPYVEEHIRRIKALNDLIDSEIRFAQLALEGNR